MRLHLSAKHSRKKEVKEFTDNAREDSPAGITSDPSMPNELPVTPRRNRREKTGIIRPRWRRSQHSGKR